jgi:thiol-disulfide isomerase/thioredoxin
MLRNLVTIFCLLITVDISAQSRYELQYDEKKMPPLPEKYTGRESYKTPGDPLPPFKLVSLPWVEFFLERDANGRSKEAFREVTPMRMITNADLPKGKNTILMFFNPGCGHCEEQTDSMLHHMEVFKNTQIILVAGHLLGPMLNGFAQKYNLRDYPQIWMGMDYDHLVEKAFLYYALPQLCVYNKDQKLVKMFSGGAPIDSLRKYLQ